MITKAEKLGLVRELMGGWKRSDVVEYFEESEDAEDKVVFSIYDDRSYQEAFTLFIKCLHLGIIKSYYDPEDTEEIFIDKFEFIIDDEYKELLVVYYI